MPANDAGPTVLFLGYQLPMPLSGDDDSITFGSQCSRSSSGNGSDESLHLGSRICVCIYWFCLVLHCCRAPLALVVNVCLLALSKPGHPHQISPTQFPGAMVLQQARHLLRAYLVKVGGIEPPSSTHPLSSSSSLSACYTTITLTAWGRTSHSRVF